LAKTPRGCDHTILHERYIIKTYAYQGAMNRTYALFM